MPEPGFIHNIDPVIAEMGGLYIWWYGLSYSFGFLGVFFWLRRDRSRISMQISEVYTLSIVLAVGVLTGGRMVEVLFYEWAYYKDHLWHIPALWLGGMSTHGILLGGIISVWLFCRNSRRSFLPVADVLAIAAAYIMAVGRIGNFIDGQIVGSVTDVWWAVKFPDLEGFRHPVVLYDGLKNLLLIPLLLWIRKYKPPRGVVFGHFVLWYGFLRIFIDFFREYRSEFLGFPPGQEFNLFMSLAGLTIITWAYLKSRRNASRTKQVVLTPASGSANSSVGSIAYKRVLFAVLVMLPAVIPSDWTYDIPNHYGHRHEGMQHSVWYPRGVYSPVK